MMATYQISYHWHDEVSHAYGKTAGQAKYNHYMHVGDCFDSFKDFLKTIKSVRKVPDLIGAYDFIERQYGVKFEVGQAVIIIGEGIATGEVGEVIHPIGQGSYVSVLLGGERCLFHPMSLDRPSCEPDQ
jgi:hypothetical protein